MNYDNPAARLLTILEAGKAQPGNSGCRQVWQGLLGVNKNNSSLLMSRLGKVMEMPEQIILTLREEFPNQKEMELHWSEQVNAGFMVQNLNASWDTFINNIDQNAMVMLRMVSNLLQSKANTKTLSSEELHAMRETILALIHETLESTLIGADLKTYLVRSLQKIVQAITEYALTGALPVLDAIDATFGHAAYDVEYRSFLTDSDLGKRLLDNLSAMANAVTVAVGLPQLAQAIQLLTGR